MSTFWYFKVNICPNFGFLRSHFWFQGQILVFKSKCVESLVLQGQNFVFSGRNFGLQVKICQNLGCSRSKFWFFKVKIVQNFVSLVKMFCFWVKILVVQAQNWLKLRVIGRNFGLKVKIDQNFVFLGQNWSKFGFFYCQNFRISQNVSSFRFFRSKFVSF